MHHEFKLQQLERKRHTRRDGARKARCPDPERPKRHGLAELPGTSKESRSGRNTSWLGVPMVDTGGGMSARGEERRERETASESTTTAEMER
ncbi:unnamed protein product [Lampetra fluviatilis]